MPTTFLGTLGFAALVLVFAFILIAIINLRNIGINYLAARLRAWLTRLKEFIAERFN